MLHISARCMCERFALWCWFRADELMKSFVVFETKSKQTHLYLYTIIRIWGVCCQRVNDIYTHLYCIVLSRIHTYIYNMYKKKLCASFTLLFLVDIWWWWWWRIRTLSLHRNNNSGTASSKNSQTPPTRPRPPSPPPPLLFFFFSPKLFRTQINHIHNYLLGTFIFCSYDLLIRSLAHVHASQHFFRAFLTSSFRCGCLCSCCCFILINWITSHHNSYRITENIARHQNEPG